MKCQKCGAEIPAGSKFCNECGTKIEQVALFKDSEPEKHRTLQMRKMWQNNTEQFSILP